MVTCTCTVHVLLALTGIYTCRFTMHYNVVNHAIMDSLHNMFSLILCIYMNERELAERVYTCICVDDMNLKWWCW